MHVCIHISVCVDFYIHKYIYKYAIPFRSNAQSSCYSFLLCCGCCCFLYFVDRSVCSFTQCFTFSFFTASHFYLYSLLRFFFSFFFLSSSLHEVSVVVHLSLLGERSALSLSLSLTARSLGLAMHAHVFTISTRNHFTHMYCDFGAQF